MSIKNKLIIFLLLIKTSCVFSIDETNTTAIKLQVLKSLVAELTKEEADQKKISVANILNHPENKDFYIEEVSKNFLKYSNSTKLIWFLFEFQQSSRGGGDYIDDSVRFLKEFINNNFIIETILFKYPEVAPTFTSLLAKNFEQSYDPFLAKILITLDTNALNSFSRRIALQKSKGLMNPIDFCLILPHSLAKDTNQLMPLFEELIDKVKDKSADKVNVVNLTNKLFTQPSDKELKSEFCQEIIKYFSDNINKISEIFYNFKIFMNLCLQRFQDLENQIKQVAMKDFLDIPRENLESIYYKLMNDQERAQLLAITTECFGLEPLNGDPTEILLKNTDVFRGYPSFVLNPCFNQNTSTQTEQHLVSNVSSVVKMLTESTYGLYSLIDNKEVFKDIQVQDFILKIHNKEKEEIKKGNYVFFHGRNKNIRFSGEIYKQLWKLKNYSKISTKKPKEFDEKLNNFIFMRFEPKSKAINERDDYFFMNHSIFGNSHEMSGASTLTGYWLRDHSAHFYPNDRFPINNLFSKQEFGLQKYYKKYENDLKKLKELHDAATKHGEIILLSIPQNRINLVKPCGPGGYMVQVKVGEQLTLDAKTILDALKHDANKVKLEDGKSADYLEWKLPLEDAYALDTFNGPDFYSFYFMDEQSKKEYENLRDQIFAKIKKDYDQDTLQNTRKLQKLRARTKRR